MKSLGLLSLLAAGVLFSGCAFHRHARPVPPVAPAARSEPVIVTPDNSLTAHVVSYNSGGRFVVLSFPVGRMPAMDQSLFLYRQGMKVAEVKITGPQRDNNIVADIVTGDVQLGDEVRDQ